MREFLVAGRLALLETLLSAKRPQVLQWLTRTDGPGHFERLAGSRVCSNTKSVCSNNPVPSHSVSSLRHFNSFPLRQGTASSFLRRRHTYHRHQRIIISIGNVKMHISNVTVTQIAGLTASTVPTPSTTVTLTNFPQPTSSSTLPLLKPDLGPCGTPPIRVSSLSPLIRILFSAMVSRCVNPIPLEPSSAWMLCLADIARPLPLSRC